MGICVRMLEDFMSDLEKEHLYRKFKSTIESELTTSQKTLAELEQTRASQKVQLADAEEIRDSSKQELEADKVYFNTFVHDCQAKSVHWSEVTKYLTETILSLDKVAFVQLQEKRFGCHVLTAVASKIEASPFDKVIRMIKELVDKLTEQVNDEATQKDWCSTELSKNEQSRTTLADDASNLKNLNDVHVAEIFSPLRATTESHRFGLTPGMLFDIRTGWNLEDPMMQFAVNEKSSTKAVLQAIDKMLVALVEEEKSDVIERDTSQTMSKSVTDEIEDDSSQQEFRRVRSIFEWASHVEYQNVSLWLKYLEMDVLNKQRVDYEEVVKKAPHNYDTWFDCIKLEESYGDV